MSSTDTIHVLLLGGADLVHMTMSPDQDGRATPSLEERLEEASGGAVSAQVVHRPIETLSELASIVDEVDVPAGSVAVLSVSCALPEASEHEDVEAWFSDTMASVIASLKARGAHVLIANASTYDPSERTHCYQGTPDPPALTLQRLDLALIELSVLDGISVIDADRIVAELGGDRVVDGLLSYRSEVANALCAEIGRILADYRFVESGPLVPQTGRRKD